MLFICILILSQSCKAHFALSSIINIIFYWIPYFCHFLDCITFVSNVSLFICLGCNIFPYCIIIMISFHTENVTLENSVSYLNKIHCFHLTTGLRVLYFIVVSVVRSHLHYYIPLHRHHHQDEGFVIVPKYHRAEELFLFSVQSTHNNLLPTQ